MSMQLFCQALVKYLLGVALTALFIFIPAGTIHYVQGWIFMCGLFIPMLFMGIALMVLNPSLLTKRLNSKEKESEQKSVIALGGLLFLGCFIIAGLSYRFDLAMIPLPASCAAIIVLLCGYCLYAIVLKENEYLSRTVEIQKNQKIVDSGLYGIVRHPMYSATIILFLSIPLVLGSLLSFVLMALYPLLIIRRIKNEEEILARDLKGYIDYMKRVPYRLIPFIW